MGHPRPDRWGIESVGMENFRLRVFRGVARHLNFRMAAEELLLTQPAVTQQIKALESEVGVPLFSRAGGRVSLTPAGAALLPYAERLKGLADEAREAVAAVSGAVEGRLRVGASQTIGQYLLPRLIAGFLAEHPRVEMELSGGNTHTVLENVRAGRVQVGLIEGPVLGNDVQVRPFMADHMVCVVGAGHEWAEGEVGLEELAQATVVTRERGSGSRRVVEQAMEAAGVKVKELKVGMTFDSTEGLLSAVEAGLGVGFVSRWAVRNQVALGTLRIARVKGLWIERMFSLVTVAGPEAVGVSGAFLGFVMEKAEGMTVGRKGWGSSG